MFELFNHTLPVLLSFILGLIVYMVKAILNLSHRVLTLEIKIETLIREIERLRCDKKDTQD
jgi:type III secretory pathway component EscS